MESARKPISTQLQLRAAHQARAEVAAVTGRTPASFEGDPTFADLVEAKREEKNDDSS